MLVTVTPVDVTNAVSTATPSSRSATLCAGSRVLISSASRSHAPISPAYSLLSSDFGKLRTILGLLTPGLVFANDGGPFARALYQTVPDDIELVVARNPLGDRPVTLFEDLIGEEDASGVAAARAKVTPDTIAKFLFTSGSTAQPKAVLHAHGALVFGDLLVQQEVNLVPGVGDSIYAAGEPVSVSVGSSDPGGRRVFTSW